MVKKILRVFVIETTALYLTSVWIQGLVFQKGPQSIVLTGFALAVAALLVKPIINILILPINLVTFNVFKSTSHAITFFLVDLALAEFSITSFRYPGLTSELLDIPPLFFEQGVAAYLAFSIVVSVIAYIIYWLME